MRRSLLVVPLAFLLLAQCGSAVAATVRLDDQRGVLIYRAAHGERNDLTIGATGKPAGGGPATFLFEDSVPIVAGTRCSSAGGSRSSYSVRCEPGRPADDVRLRVSLGDRNDRVSVSADYPLETLLRGGSGNDFMVGGPGADIFGEGSAPNGSDTMLGGSGAGPAYLTEDRVRYLWRRHAVRADLAGDRDDGVRGEGDRIGTDVEGITGGRAGDRLSGNGERNRLIGGGGADAIAGLGGSDTIFAGALATERARTADRLHGGPGSDQLFGSDGGNVIDGGPAADLIYAGGGRDRVRALDGAVDEVLCRKGVDTTANDPFDFLIRCERTAPASDSPAVPLWLNVWQDSTGATVVDAGVACLERQPARACEGKLQLELDGQPVSPETAFTGLSGHRQLVLLHPSRNLDPARTLDLAVRVRSRTAAGAPTDDLFPASALLLGFAFQ
jgi:RTX calcium-binding nonapeptide repeat (4 copies)